MNGTNAGGGPELDLLTTFGSLVFVVAIILGLAWLLKRMRLPAMGNQQGLAILSQIPVGTKERIAVVKVNDEQFLVGITSQSINLISKLENPVEPECRREEGKPGIKTFAEQFRYFSGKHDKE